MHVYFRDNNQSFRSLAAFDPETPFVSWNQNGIGQSIQCQFVSGNFFSVCGVNTILDRAFTAEEDRQPGAAPVAMVSHAFWKNHLGSDPQIVGRTLSINGITLTVKGVAPAGFTGLLAGLSPDLWVPFMMAPSVLHDPEWHIRTGAFSLFGVGRLRPGIKSAQAEAELTALTRRFEEIDPKPHKDRCVMNKTNIEHPTSNAEHRRRGHAPDSTFDVQCSMFDVRCFPFHL